MPKIVIVRGLPGSGKSTYARKLAEETDAIHIESDMYFERTGEYIFNPRELSDAHQWCQDKFWELYRDRKDIIISNTFTKEWEAENYFGFLNINQEDHNYETEVITLTENYGSIHGVPEATLEKMKNRFVSHEKFCDYFGVKHD